jgi:hypothetical protein
MRWVTDYHVAICREVCSCHGSTSLSVKLCGILCSDVPLSQIFIKNLANYLLVNRQLLLHQFQGHLLVSSH